jgi:hypothetical protein
MIAVQAITHSHARPNASDSSGNGLYENRDLPQGFSVAINRQQAK